MKTAPVIFSVCTLALSLQGKVIELQNDFHSLRIEPGNGGRISGWIVKGPDENLVKTWDGVKRQGKRKTVKQQYSGGILGGHMCGAYQDEQLEAVYAVLKQTPDQVVMRWENPFVLFNGLEETRTITLDGKAVRVGIRIENKAKETRVIYYRLQDFMGTGSRLGEQTVWLYPGRDGVEAAVFSPGETAVLMELPEPWYAQTNFVKDYGFKVTATGAPLRNILFWVGSDASRTGELFWVPKTLQPGEVWEAGIEYALFTPSKETGSFGETAIRAALAKKQSGNIVRAGSACSFVPAYGKAVVTPIESCGETPVGLIRERFRTLEKMELFGTPGETVPGAFSLTALEDLGKGTLSFGPFKTSDGKVLKLEADPYFITRDGLDYMTRNWKFADGLPPEAANAKSTVKGEKTLTPFRLKKQESVHFRTYFRLPKNAAPGEYSGQCFLTTEAGGKYAFTIGLKVYPFTLELPKDKGYGAFSTFSLTGDKHGAAEFGYSRENFRKAMKELTDRNWRNLVLYLSNPENILWALDTFAELGWRDARFVVIRPHVPYAELVKRYGKYNFTFLPWGVDEPVDYHSVKQCEAKYRLFEKKYDYPNMNFSANTPLSLAIIDSLPKTHPTIAITGNVMYFVEKTRDLAKQGRQVFWYAGTPGRDPKARLVRGIYVWKEPTGGMMDWGEMAGAKSVGNAFHAFFADGELRPSQRLENMTSALTDLLYLNTLEQTLKQVPASAPEAKEATRFLEWIRSRFGIDYVGDADGMDHAFLDMIRRQAAEHTARLIPLKKGR
ncbi:MAG: hypothetical protein BWY31_01581 [Lentisphaerae bacterium ADurb.Bin242]|nr:MAG: hypothetical protein BWY31_01581 [Lentisphaerae bacterium ADurb.Bin242]